MQQPLAAFGYLQVLLAIQQPLAAFKLCLLYSNLWLPSSCDCYTAAFGCFQVLLATQQPSAAFKLLTKQQPSAFKLLLLNSSLQLLFSIQQVKVTTQSQRSQTRRCLRSLNGTCICILQAGNAPTGILFVIGYSSIGIWFYFCQLE